MPSQWIMLTLTCLSESVKCSIVLDHSSPNQKGVFIRDYCPKMKYCPEGAHVMCMYYNPTYVMSPRCRHPRNVSITPELANKLLDVSNAARSKIARGQEKGENEIFFPRGYGIFRLKWDTELATFAQVLANQCVLRHDLCRATKRFPDPGQTAGLVRFSDPDWIPKSKSNITKPGLDNEKLMYATTQSLKSWYGQKKSVSVQMLTNYPDWDSDTHKTQSGRLYLEMIYGPSTHMGCGISAYNEYAFQNNNASLTYNSVQIICNYSGRPRKGGAVYNTVPPTDTASSFNQCGCPAGSIEDDDCLCREVTKEPDPPPVQLATAHKTRKCAKSLNCEPTVVLLPIFTVEDAPPDKLISPERFANSSFGQMRRMVADSFEELMDNNVSGNRRNMHNSPAMENYNTAPNGKQQRPVTRNHISVRHRHFDKPNEWKSHDNRKEYEDKKTRKSMTNHLSRPSIFAKTPKFELPGTRNFLKIDVVPRKDFSKGKKLVGKYLFNKMLPREGHGFSRNHKNTVTEMNEVNSVEIVSLNRDLQKYLHPKIRKRTKGYHKDVQFKDILTTETVLNTAEQRVINHNIHMKDLNITHDFDKIDAKITTTEENDKKLMALLDTLEQEVKHIELRDKEKQIFDAKIKKIYGKIVGDKTLGSNEMKHVKVYDAKRELKQKTKHEPKFKSKHKVKYEPKAELKPEAKDESKPEATHEPKHEPTHAPTHMDFDLESIEHGKDSKDHDMLIKDRDNLSDDDNSVHNLEPSHDKFKYETDISDLRNIHREPHDMHDIETEGFEKYPKHDTQSIDTELDDLTKRPMSKNHKIMFKKGNKSRLRYRQNLRQRNNNDLDSLEYLRHTYIDNGYRERKSYNNNRHFDRSELRNNIGEPKYRSNSLDHKFGRRRNIYGNDAWYEDPLSAERRKYYQDKLDDMERRLHSVRHSARRKDASRPRHMRAMRPSVRSDNQMDSLYTAGRARFLHGY